jgi:hypothetical protein
LLTEPRPSLCTRFAAEKAVSGVERHRLMGDRRLIGLIAVVSALGALGFPAQPLAEPNLGAPRLAGT